MTTRTALLLCLTLAALPGAAAAQKPYVPRPIAPLGDEADADRIVAWGGGGLVLALPVGEFSRYVNVGGGLNLFGALPLARRGAASIRLDATFLIYGSETRRAPLSGTVQLVTVEVTTSNQIIGLAIGPQLTATSGGIRPYVNGQVGFSYFATVSSVRGTNDVEDFARSTNFDDITLALRGGAGVWLRLTHGRTPVWLDLSAEYVRNGRVQYLREGSITFDQTGAPIYHPIESETHLWQVQVGIAVGAPARRP